MTLSPDLIKRLTYSKYLLHRAQQLYEQRAELSVAETVLTMHDAAEMLMGVVTDHLGISPNYAFMEFWSKVSQKGFQEPLGRSAWDRLNQLRVGFKHKGNLPNPSVVADLMPGAKAFFVETTRLLLDVDYETVSLADLIPNAEARKNIKDAEKSVANDDLPCAMLSLGLAFDEIYRDARHQSRHALVQRPWRTRGFSGEAREWRRTLGVERLQEQLDDVTDTLNMVLLSIDPAKVRYFTALTPIRQRTAAGTLDHRWQRDPKNLQPQDYNFCLEFVINLGLRVTA